MWDMHLFNGVFLVTKWHFPVDAFEFIGKMANSKRGESEKDKLRK
jgi:hypothetical protein